MQNDKGDLSLCSFSLKMNDLQEEWDRWESSFLLCVCSSFSQSLESSSGCIFMVVSVSLSVSESESVWASLSLSLCYCCCVVLGFSVFSSVCVLFSLSSRLICVRKLHARIERKKGAVKGGSSTYIINWWGTTQHMVSTERKLIFEAPSKSKSHALYALFGSQIFALETSFWK